MGLFSLRWEASALTAAPAWEARLLDWEQFSTTRVTTSGSAVDNIKMISELATNNLSFSHSIVKLLVLSMGCEFSCNFMLKKLPVIFVKQPKIS